MTFQGGGKCKVFPYSLPSAGPRADPGVEAVSPQVTLSHPPSSRLPLLSAMPAATFPAKEHHRSSPDTKLYCIIQIIEAHECKPLAKGCYLEVDRPRFERATFWIVSKHSTVMLHSPHQVISTCTIRLFL